MPLEADLRDIQSAEYSGQVQLPPIAEKEVRDAIRTASPLNALGLDRIANWALQAGTHLIATYLTRIFN